MTPQLPSKIIYDKVRKNPGMHINQAILEWLDECHSQKANDKYCQCLSGIELCDKHKLAEPTATMEVFKEESANDEIKRLKERIAELENFLSAFKDMDNHPQQAECNGDCVNQQGKPFPCTCGKQAVCEHEPHCSGCRICSKCGDELPCIHDQPHADECQPSEEILKQVKKSCAEAEASLSKYFNWLETRYPIPKRPPLPPISKGELPEKKEYKYFRQIHRRQSSRKGRKISYSYYTVIGEKPVEVSKADYEANIEQSKKDAADAFMSRGTKECYWEYYIQDSKEVDIWNACHETFTKILKDKGLIKEDV